MPFSLDDQGPCGQCGQFEYGSGAFSNKSALLETGSRFEYG